MLAIKNENERKRSNFQKDKRAFDESIGRNDKLRDDQIGNSD